MDQTLAYQVIRMLIMTHQLQRHDLQIRYVHAANITAEAIRSAAAAVLKQSDLNRQLDLKNKYGKATAADAQTERAILSRIADSDNDINIAMQELIDFYKSLAKEG